MALFHFVTDVDVDAPPEQLWNVLANPSTWPGWWRWLRRVDEVDPGREDGTGARYRMVFGTALPFTLTVESETVHVVRPSIWESRATGDLVGTGLWELSTRNGGSHVRYTWIVAPARRWQNLLAPMARPAFSWNHGVLMRDFAAGFAGAAGARLLSVENRTIKPGAPGFGRLPGSTVS